MNANHNWKTLIHAELGLLFDAASFTAAQGWSGEGNIVGLDIMSVPTSAQKCRLSFQARLVERVEVAPPVLAGAREALTETLQDPNPAVREDARLRLANLDLPILEYWDFAGTKVELSTLDGASLHPFGATDLDARGQGGMENVPAGAICVLGLLQPESVPNDPKLQLEELVTMLVKGVRAPGRHSEFVNAHWRLASKRATEQQFSLELEALTDDAARLKVELVQERRCRWQPEIVEPGPLKLRRFGTLPLGEYQPLFPGPPIKRSQEASFSASSRPHASSPGQKAGARPAGSRPAFHIQPADRRLDQAQIAPTGAGIIIYVTSPAEALRDAQISIRCEGQEARAKLHFDPASGLSMAEVPLPVPFETAKTADLQFAVEA